MLSTIYRTNKLMALRVLCACVRASLLYDRDYYEPNWQRSFWGTNYPRLLEVKKEYDPHGLFTCHHCVGSELQSADGNCQL